MTFRKLAPLFVGLFVLLGLAAIFFQRYVIAGSAFSMAGFFIHMACYAIPPKQWGLVAWGYWIGGVLLIGVPFNEFMRLGTQ